MTETPKILRAHHLKTLKLPTFLQEYQKVARQCAAEGLDHVQFLSRLVELELIDRERRMIERRIKAAFAIVLGPCMDGPLGKCFVRSFGIWSVAAMYTASRLRHEAPRALMKSAGRMGHASGASCATTPVREAREIERMLCGGAV